MADRFYLSKALSKRVIDDAAKVTQSPEHPARQRWNASEKEKLLALIHQKEESIVSLREEINTLVLRLSKPDLINITDMRLIGNILAEGIYQYGNHTDGCPAYDTRVQEDCCTCGFKVILDRALEFRRRF